MSCVVGVARRGHVYIAGDSFGCKDNAVEVRLDQKVFAVGNRLIVGFAGNYRAGQVVEQDLTLPRTRKAYTDFEYVVKCIVPQIRRSLRRHRVYENEEKRTPPEVDFLVGFNGVIYRIEHDMQVTVPRRNYDAIGAGQEYALGSFHTSSGVRDPIRRMELALDAAVAHCPWVGPPFIGFQSEDQGVVPIRL